MAEWLTSGSRFRSKSMDCLNPDLINFDQITGLTPCTFTLFISSSL